MKCCFASRIGIGALVLACAIGVVSAVGCHSGEKKDTKAMASTKAVNTMCVVNPHDEVDPSVTADYKGQKVGFCCSKCKAKWDKMSDADKAAMFKAATTAK
jgi:hypothetical protein